jgi:hypothetical protein
VCQRINAFRIYQFGARAHRTSARRRRSSRAKVNTEWRRGHGEIEAGPTRAFRHRGGEVPTVKTVLGMLMTVGGIVLLTI